MGASFGDLFEVPPGVVVLDGFLDTKELGDQAKVYNCMDVTKNNVKHQKITIGMAEKGKVVVVRSAYPLANPKGDFKNSFHMLLDLKPVPLVSSMLVDLTSTSSSPILSVGVHVRSTVYDTAVGTRGDEGLVKYMGMETAERTKLQRRASGWTQFVKAMEKVLEENSEVRFYLSADNADAYTGLSSHFGPSVLTSLPRSNQDDSTRRPSDVQYALADMINLGRTEVILGSMGSSFTDVAAGFNRGGKRKSTVKVAGVDFGRNPCVGKGWEEGWVEGKLGEMAEGGNDESLGIWGGDEFREYQGRVLSYWSDVLSIFPSPSVSTPPWPTDPSLPPYATLGIYSKFLHSLSSTAPTLKSIYLPIPWSEAVLSTSTIPSTSSSGATVRVSDLLRDMIDGFFKEVYEDKYPHFTVMFGTYPTHAMAAMRRRGGGGGGGEGGEVRNVKWNLEKVVVFGDTRNRRGKGVIPVPAVGGEFTGMVGTLNDRGREVYEDWILGGEAERGGEVRVPDGTAVKYRRNNGKGQWTRDIGGYVNGGRMVERDEGKEGGGRREGRIWMYNITERWDGGKLVKSNLKGKGIKVGDRIGGENAREVRRAWYPYRDIGVDWSRLSVSVPDYKLNGIEEVLEKEIDSGEWEERREYLDEVKWLFTEEGIFRYLLYKVTHFSGFAMLVSTEYCDALARSKRKEIGDEALSWIDFENWRLKQWEIDNLRNGVEG
ncbi:hypothetical protein TrCOL_g50 [Triparma columacea]|uniref:Uncharacterized protein n=1 Tax=Triparma columacea TaxID=722753 RepID=A0A9W7FX32_9STRA|nr:hypothetical protein TrCOL_g50 [Triparma columacea]